MVEKSTREDHTDRLFLNLLIILKGVVIAYGATVLVGLLRSDVPWAGWEIASLYLAWLGTTLLVTLTFVSQAFESGEGPFAPTVLAIGVTFAGGITEFVAYGTLEADGLSGSAILPNPSPGWFLAIGCVDLLAVCIIWIATHQSRALMARYRSLGSSDPDSVDGSRHSKVSLDLVGALFHAVSAFAMALVLVRTEASAGWTFTAVAVLSASLLLPLRGQQIAIVKRARSASR